MKDNVLTRGGLASGKSVVTTNGKKSADVIVAMSMREGPNLTSVKVGGTETQRSHRKVCERMHLHGE